MASKSGKGKGSRSGGRRGRRSFIVFALLGFFVVAMGVIARRTFGINQARSLRALATQRDAIDASRVTLEVEIRDASSRARLVPIVEQRLRMYVPADSQIIILKRASSPEPSPRK